MYLLADLFIILVFLIGSAVLGFLLGRRSTRGPVTQLQEQLEERQRMMTDLKTKLNRCSAKRVALERELTEVHTHLSGQGIDPTAMSQERSKENASGPSASYAPPVSSRGPGTMQTNPGQRFRNHRTGEASRPSFQPTPASNSAPKPPSKQDEVLQRVRERASKVNFDRIGTAEARHRDDLKQIKGLGIFTEKKLNALGIYTYAQIARFTERDQQVINAVIEYPAGRIARDEWVTQARELAGL